jgi:hypothetical protein
VWTASDLQIVVAETDTNPFTGTRTVTMVSLEHTSPPADRFTLPHTLTVRPGFDSTQLARLGLPTFDPARLAGLSLPHSESLEYRKALDDVANPETREKAADDLVAYAHMHKEVANHVAHVLAARNTHMDDAVALGRSSLDESEQGSSAIVIDRILVGDLALMNDLAEYWDTWGWIRWLQGDEAAAKNYCRAAWELGGEGLYADHLARIAMKDGDTEAARHLLHVALSGMVDEREKNQIINDLAKLGTDTPDAVDEPVAVVFPDSLAMRGTAEFWLLFSGGEKPQVKWAGGDEKLALLASAIATAKYPPQMPDNGPEHVLRRARIVCQETDCRLTMLYSFRVQRDFAARQAGMRN